MSDNLINVKEAIWDFVANTVTNTGNGFQNYFLTPYSQIYWEWTRSDGRSIFPYIFFEIESDDTLGYSTFSSYEKRIIDEETKFYRIDKEFHILTIGFNFCSMRDDINGLTGLEAQNLANSLARLIRRKLMSDESLDWFNYAGNTDGVHIGTQTQDISIVQYLPDYEDTKPKHRFRFTCPFNWEDTYETEINMAEAAEIIRINDEDTSIIIDNT